MPEMNKNYLHNMFIDEVEGALHRNCVTEEKVDEKILQAQIGGDGEVDLSMYAKAIEVAQLKSDLTEEVIARQTAITTETAERKAEIAVERERINQFVSLKEGSTTGDAELLDARIDKDGNSHPDVGEHIRNITSKLSDEKVELWKDSEIELEWSDGYINKNGTYISNGNNWYLKSQNITIPKYIKKIKIHNMCTSDQSTIVFYSGYDTNTEKIIINYVAPTDNVFDVPDGAKSYIITSNKTKNVDTKVLYEYNSKHSFELEILKTTGMVDIRLFDGVSDGEDITTALQTAIDFCYENNCALYVPCKNYIVSSPITIYSRTRICGDNGIVKETDVDKVNVWSLKYTGSGSMFSNVTEKAEACIIKNLIFVSSTKNNTALFVNGLRWKIENCSFVNFNIGIYLNNNINASWAGEIFINDCFFVYCWVGIRIEYTNVGYINDSKFYNNVFVYGSYSLYADFLSAIHFKENHDYTENGVYCGRTASHFCVEGNYFDNNGESIYLAPLGNGNTIKNNIFYVREESDVVFSVITLRQNYGTGSISILCNEVVGKNIYELANFIEILEANTTESPYVIKVVAKINMYDDLGNLVTNNGGSGITLVTD